MYVSITILFDKDMCGGVGVSRINSNDATDKVIAISMADKLVPVEPIEDDPFAAHPPSKNKSGV